MATPQLLALGTVCIGLLSLALQIIALFVDRGRGRQLLMHAANGSVVVALALSAVVLFL
ncbi:hypothetical protein ACIGKR_31010 [Rhodococcus qingshengii]|uniref:hypothetical protein n=1 Tax=Rhodococcus TaxID=1827 RepID=UPI003626CDFC